MKTLTLNKPKYVLLYIVLMLLNACNGSSDEPAVIDITPPVITLNNQSSIDLFVNKNYQEFGATAHDNIDGDVEVKIDGVVDTNTVGTYIITYSATDSAGNTSLVNRNISVKLQRAFITTWQTDKTSWARSNDNQIYIGVQQGSHTINYQVDWGDGAIDDNVTGNITHTYSAIGTYTVKITGDFPGIYFEPLPIVSDYVPDPTNDSDKLLTVEQWGDIEWQSMNHAFYRCSFLTVNATDTPDLSSLTDMSWMFSGTSAFNHDISNWVVSNITNMSGMFSGTAAFNQDLSNWNVSNVTNMSRMFNGAAAFNHDLSNWNVSNVTDMHGMFSGAIAFNQDLSNWNVSNVTDMHGMFSGAAAFNHDLSNWSVSNVTDMNGMFSGATAFNQNINNWNVSNVTDMGAMFSHAIAFNQDLSNWDVSNVINMEKMFSSANVFNQSIGSWDVSNVISMGEMFAGTVNFNQDLSNWDVSNVTNMNRMFESSIVFNQDLSYWNVSNVTHMRRMFSMSVAFNQNIGNWDVSNVYDFEGMFAYSKVFNQNLSSWDVSNASEMAHMFEGVTLSTINYDALLSSWSSLPVRQNINFDGGHSKYSSSSQSARDLLTNYYGWKILDAGIVL